MGPSGPDSTLPSTAYRYMRYKNDDGTINEWAQKAIDNAHVKSVEVYVKGPGIGRESAIRSLMQTGIEVSRIIDITPIIVPIKIPTTIGTAYLFKLSN